MPLHVVRLSLNRSKHLHIIVTPKYLKLWEATLNIEALVGKSEIGKCIGYN